MTLVVILCFNSCSKKNDEILSVSETPNALNPPIIPDEQKTDLTPRVIAPEFTAQKIGENLNKKWLQLKKETYIEKSIDPKTGREVSTKRLYLPTDTKFAFCFPDYKNEEITSNYNPYRTGFEIASISKLFTSLWAIQSYQKKYVLLPKTFKTQVSYDQETGELFIKGNLDPLFGIDRLEDALRKIQYKLQKNSITEKVSIQKIHIINFIQLPIYTSQTSFELPIYDHGLNLSANNGITKKSLTNVAKYLQKNKNSFFINTNFSTFEVFSYKNLQSFEDSISGKTITITSVQRPLNQLLYFINTFSHNLGSDLLFQLLGGNQAFMNFLEGYLPPNFSNIIHHGQEDRSLHLGYDNHVPFNFYNGSGLPQVLPHQEDELTLKSSNEVSLTAHYEASEDLFGEEFGSSKFRNKATCELIFKTIENLYESKSFFKTSLEELLPINGSGTLKRSFSNQIPMGTFVGKTGSLNNLMTLAGALKTRYGMRPFFFSFFRPNLDAKGNYRSNGFTSKSSVFVRSTLTTQLVKLLAEYYTQQGFFKPQVNLLAQLNVHTFLAKSYEDINSLNVIE